MKCTVCGYDITDGKSYCPVCNTKIVVERGLNPSVSAVQPKSFDARALDDDTVDMSWNTRDFPKPKKLEDIEMKWGNFNSYMNKDASEGFVAVKNEQPQPVKPAPVEEPAVKKQIPPTQTPKHNEPVFSSWSIPPQQTVPETPLWYTQNFTASGVMKTGPAYAIPPQAVPSYEPVPVRTYAPAPAEAPVQNAPAAKIAEPVAYSGLDTQQAMAAFQSVVPDATIQYMRVDPPKPVYEYPKAAAIYTEPKPEPKAEPVATPVVAPALEPMPEPAEEEAAAEVPASDFAPIPEALPANEQTNEKRPEMFNTFVQKNEEFQKLLDREYERIHAIHGDSYDPVVPERRIGGFEPESTVKAQGISDFENSLFGNTSLGDVRKNDVKPVTGGFMHESDESEIDLEELISDPLNPNFNIHTLEKTISELKAQDAKDEAKRSERKAKLAAMEAAREAYFRSLDEDLGIPPKTSPAPASEPEAEISEEKPEEPAAAAAEETTEAPAEEYAVSDAMAINFDDFEDEPEEEATPSAPMFFTTEIPPVSKAPEKDMNDVNFTLNGFGTPKPEADSIDGLLAELPETKAAGIIPEEETELPQTETEFPQAEAELPQAEAELPVTDVAELINDSAAASPEAEAPAAAEEDKRSTKDLDKMTRELKALYPDDDKKEEEKTGSSHFFLSFIIAVIVIAVIFKAMVFGFSRFLPELPFTEALLSIDEAIMAAITSLISKFSKATSSIISNFSKSK